MKIWKAQEVYIGGTDEGGDIKLTAALNNIQKNGWIIEGMEFFGKDNKRVMIIAIIEEPLPVDGRKPKHLWCVECGARNIPLSEEGLCMQCYGRLI